MTLSLAGKCSTDVLYTGTLLLSRNLTSICLTTSAHLHILRYMAKYVSNSAGRLGRYFSRGDDIIERFFPSNATEAFEDFIGVDNLQQEMFRFDRESRASVVLKMKEVQNALLEAKPDDEVFAEPTVKLAAEGKLDELLGLISGSRSLGSTKEKKT